jgi:signal transduction histidine kinase
MVACPSKAALSESGVSEAEGDLVMEKIRSPSIITPVPFLKRLSAIDVRASIALIAIAVGALGLMQYNWFRASAAMELESEYYALGAAANQAASREFQRYAALFDDLRALAATSPAEAKRLLAREYGLYGPSGSVPRLLSEVGFSSISESETAMSLSPSGAWSSGRSRISLAMLKDSTAGLARGEIVIRQAADERRFILAPFGKDGLAILEIDANGFLEVYVKPAIAAVLPKAEIDWSFGRQPGGERGDEPPRMGYSADYGFNPLSAIFRGGSEETRSFEIFFPAIVGEPFARDRPGRAMARARVHMPASSVIGSIERRLALNWLFGTILLVGIGVAFSLVILQMQKVRSMRKREREFVASITHELRTPVTAIRSAADNLRMGLVGSDRIPTYGEMIHAQSLRLGSMIEEVLAFAQVEANTFPQPRLEPVAAAALEAELRSPLDAIARAEGIALSWDFGAIPPSFLCDEESLRLALSNLVANALYHAYPLAAKGEVRVVGKACLPAGIRFIVEDDGRGIAKSESALVFEAFYRDEASRARHEKGSGLGLFIARRKARLLGGELRLESPYERADGSRRSGCRFTLELPHKEDSYAR